MVLETIEPIFPSGKDEVKCLTLYVPHHDLIDHYDMLVLTSDKGFDPIF